jgi:hypothetical protein
MRIIFILIFLQFLDLNITAQVKQTLISNNWYFSQSDTLFFSRTRIKTNNIRQIKEYRTDKKYADSAQLMSEYYFDTLGSLIESKTYDIHGSPSVTKFKIASNGKMTEIWVADRNGVLKKTSENIYNGSKLIKQISYYGQDYAPSMEYTYSTDGLVSIIQYFDPTGIKGAIAVFTYDSLNRLVSEVTKNPGDSIGLSYSYKYDKLGRRYFTQYKEATLVWTETIDYSKSTSNYIVERIYSGDKLNAIITKKINQQGIIIELIVDKRMSTKRRKKNNMFCGYSGPPRYQKWTYEYDSKGNLVCEKNYYSPNKISEQTQYTFDSKGNLINKIIYGNSKKDSEWSYSYN